MFYSDLNDYFIGNDSKRFYYDKIPKSFISEYSEVLNELEAAGWIIGRDKYKKTYWIKRPVFVRNLK